MFTNARSRYRKEDEELDDFVSFLASGNFSKEQLFDFMKRFLQAKIDPPKKFVLVGYDNNEQVFYKEYNKFDPDHDGFRMSGYRANKVKLQVRLNDQKDVDNLMKILEYINKSFEEMNEEEKINQQRYETLKDILDDDSDNSLSIKNINYKNVRTK
jgi:hypothetical protein